MQNGFIQCPVPNLFETTTADLADWLPHKAAESIAKNIPPQPRMPYNYGLGFSHYAAKTIP